MVGVDCTLPVRQYSPNSQEGAASASEQAARSGEAFRQSLTLWDLEGESKVEPPDQQRRSFPAEQLDETFVKFQEEVPGMDPQVAQAHVGFPALQRRRALPRVASGPGVWRPPLAIPFCRGESAVQPAGRSAYPALWRRRLLARRS